MESLIVSLLNGVIYGLLLFMVSAGLTLIFGMMGVLNFAHASFYMLGAYFAYALQSSLGFWGALLASPMLVGLVGVVDEKYFLRRVHHHGHAHELLLTFGLSFIIAELVKLFFGNFPVDYRIPASMDFALFRASLAWVQRWRAWRAPWLAPSTPPTQTWRWSLGSWSLWWSSWVGWAPWAGPCSLRCWSA